MTSQTQLNKIIKLIADNYHPDKIILYGSYASGNPKEDSDVDLLIIKDVEEPRYKRCRKIRKYLRGLKVPLDLIVYTHKEIEKWKDVKTAFITNILQTGKVVYG